MGTSLPGHLSYMKSSLLNQWLSQETSMATLLSLYQMHKPQDPEIHNVIQLNI